MYLDDIIVLGTDFKDTMAALRKVFLRFREHNLKFKPRKCQFFKQEVAFLGKLVNGDGVTNSPDKLEVVRKWPVPQNSKQLLSFFGFYELSSRTYLIFCEGLCRLIRTCTCKEVHLDRPPSGLLRRTEKSLPYLHYF